MVVLFPGRRPRKNTKQDQPKVSEARPTRSKFILNNTFIIKEISSCPFPRLILPLLLGNRKMKHRCNVITLKGHPCAKMVVSKYCSQHKNAVDVNQMDENFNKIINIILPYLDFSSIINLCLINKSIKNKCYDENFWRMKLFDCFEAQNIESSLIKFKSYKEQFISMIKINITLPQNIKMDISELYLKIMYNNIDNFVSDILKLLPTFINSYQLHSKIIIDHIDNCDKKNFIYHFLRAKYPTFL
jgi:septum formation topological specificity factor MinE